MALIPDTRKSFAVVTYPGLSPLELIGTVSVLDGLRLNTGFRPVTVAARREPLETDTPARIIPQSTFDGVPHPYALLVPGGGLMGTIQAMGDETLLAYVRTAAAGAELVTSEGTGSLILGAAGLLHGIHATTHPAYHRILEHLGARYIRDRWVEDGKFVTAGGTSGGIDMALQLVARHKDKRTARQVQLWIEYDPQPPFGPLGERDADEDTLAPLLTAHETDWRRALAHRPDLLEAVRRAAYPVAPSGINR